MSETLKSLTQSPMATGLRLAIFSSMALGTASEAVAQTAPTREQVEVPRPDGEAAPARVRIDREGAIEQGPCPLRESDIRVTLQSVRYEAPAGETVAPELQALLAPVGVGMMGDQPISAVCDIRDRANAELRRAGYVAQVQIPPQEVITGELLLTVVAARIIDIRVRGNADRYREALRPRIEALKALNPLNERDAERILLLAGDIPGLDVQLVLRAAGTKPGEVIGELSVDTQTALVLANVQNAGSRQLGRYLGTIRGEFYGLTGLQDLTYLAISNSFQFDEQHIVQAGHEVGLGGGVRFGVRGNYAISQPDILNLDLKSKSLIAGWELSAPLYRSVKDNLSIAGGFELIDQTTRVGGGGGPRVPFTRDRIRSLYARLSGVTRELGQTGDVLWGITGDIEFRQGIDVFKASPRRQVVDGFAPSRFDGDSKATIVRGNVDFTFKIADRVTLNASAYGQWANNPLLNIDEFSIGNLTYGRGYDPGANGADRVVAFRVEPRAEITRSDNGSTRLEVAGFYDNVRIWNLDRGAIETRRTLDSIGGGFRLVVQNRIAVDLTYAKPLKRALLTDPDKPTDRLLLSVTTRLFPFRNGR